MVSRGRPSQRSCVRSRMERQVRGRKSVSAAVNRRRRSTANIFAETALVKSFVTKLLFGLTVPLLALALLPSRSAAASPPAEFEIKEWPANLRTDLKGSSIKVVLPENAPDRPWDDALIAKFQHLTGIEVEIVRPGNDTTVVLATYLRDFGSGTPGDDVYAIDIVWPGILKDY